MTIRKTLGERLAKFTIPEPNSGCWLWTGGTYLNGYGTIKIDRKQEGAHRASWTWFRGKIPNGLFVLHKCDVPSCCNPDHLFLGSHSENMKDMVTKERGNYDCNRGERNAHAKLSDDDVVSIRSDPRGPSAISREYGVRREYVWALRRNKHRSK